MSKTQYTHLDILKRPINVEDIVAFPSANSLVVGRVDKINPRMIGIKSLKSQARFNKYPSDVVILPPEEVSLYLLKV